MRTFKEASANYAISLLFLSGKYQFTHILYSYFCIRIIIIVWRTTPEGLLIQLYLFDVSTSIHHGSKV